MQNKLDFLNWFSANDESLRITIARNIAANENISLSEITNEIKSKTRKGKIYEIQAERFLKFYKPEDTMKAAQYLLSNYINN